MVPRTQRSWVGGAVTGARTWKGALGEHGVGVTQPQEAVPALGPVGQARGAVS